MRTIRRSDDGTTVRIATLTSRLQFVFLLELAWVLPLLIAGALPIRQPVVVGLPVLVLAFTTGWLLWSIGPFVELNPRGVVVRNGFRSYRLFWEDITGFGEGTLNTYGVGEFLERSGGFALTVWAARPIPGLRTRDLPSQIREMYPLGAAPRNVIASRATRGASRRTEAHIFDAVQEFASSHTMTVDRSGWRTTQCITASEYAVGPRVRVSVPVRSFLR